MIKIQCSRNYNIFFLDETDNRKLDIPGHSKLRESMREHGFIQSYHIICRRRDDGNLTVADGQHRLNFAKELGLPVYFTIEEEEFDVSDIQKTSKTWKPKDYAQRFAHRGLKDYAEAIEFCESHRMEIGIGFALLAGRMDGKSIDRQFHNGEFKIRNRAGADRVAFMYCSVIAKAPKLRNSRFLSACIAACKVPQFDGRKFVKTLESCMDKLQSYSTRDAFLEMIEDIYNYRRSADNRISVKFEALKEMDKLNPAKNREIGRGHKED